MTVSFKDAVNKMKKDPKVKYYFFFCEKDKNGKPVLLADTKKIDPKSNDEVKKTLETAKAKGTSGGVMHIDEAGALNLKPQGGGLAASKVETGVKIAAGNAQVLNLIKGIKVGKPETKEEEDGT